MVIATRAWIIWSTFYWQCFQTYLFQRKCLNFTNKSYWNVSLRVHLTMNRLGFMWWFGTHFLSASLFNSGFVCSKSALIQVLSWQLWGSKLWLELMTPKIRCQRWCQNRLILATVPSLPWNKTFFHVILKFGWLFQTGGITSRTGTRMSLGDHCWYFYSDNLSFYSSYCNSFVRQVSVGCHN